jgi:2-dehydro-3-deoxyphosphooctonate aldolase (KDO 8-P synthase)
VAQPRPQESDFFRSLKAARPFFLMAGPNVVESEAHCLKMARQIKAVTDALGLQLVFKASFDKANRTSAASFRGPGLEEGLRRAPCRPARFSLHGRPARAVWPAGLTAVSARRPAELTRRAACRVLKVVKETLGLPVITDIHDASQAEAIAEVADIIQIPAFLCRQTDLIVAAARTGRVIHIKKGQFCAPSVMRNSADKARWAGVACSVHAEQQRMRFMQQVVQLHRDVRILCVTLFAARLM